MRHLLLCLVLLNLLSCQSEPGNTTRLGDAAFAVTGAPKAQQHFQKGLLLLHSFEYEDARRSFQAAREADSTMAMAYWGEAMTHNHTLWREQDYERGRAVLDMLPASEESTPTLSSTERSFLAAVDLLYAEDKDKKERDREYAVRLGELHDKYPQEQEIAAFYALSLLGMSEERNVDNYEAAAEIAKKVLKENPRHPGALHYLIHSYDDPQHAELALEAAFSYSRVAPDASHALHMPSHIFVALGMWDEVIRSNQRSYQASLHRMEAQGLSNNARGYHAFHWLQYGLLQQGKTEAAADMLREMEGFARETPSGRARGHLSYLQGTFLNETNSWTHPLADMQVDVSDLNIIIQAQRAWIAGRKAFEVSDTAGLDAIIHKLTEKRKREALIPGQDEKDLCFDLDRSVATRADLARVMAIEQQLRALAAQLRNDTSGTEAYLQAAVAAEEDVPYQYGPPLIQKPSHEQYAEWLIAQQRFAEAQQPLQQLMDRNPSRLRGLQAQLQVASALADQARAAELRERIIEQTGAIDL